MSRYIDDTPITGSVLAHEVEHAVGLKLDRTYSAKGIHLAATINALVAQRAATEFHRQCAADANAQLNAMRRLLDEARTTLVGIATVTPKYWELPRDQFIDEFLPWAQSRARDTAAKIAAPVPAQPAVPDDADQNALRLALVWRVATGRETDEERAELGAVSPDATYGEFIAGIDAAILSATETEGRKDE